LSAGETKLPHFIDEETTLRFHIHALRVVFLLAPLLLGACEDRSAEIQAVQNTRMRLVAGSGETNTGQLGMTLAQYIKSEFRDMASKVTWSGSDLPVADGGAPLVGVDATMRASHPFLPKEVVLHFSYEQGTQKVRYLGADISGKPAATASGTPIKLASINNAIIDRMQARAKTIMGNNPAFNQQMDELDKEQEQHN
jgi:hypothetical protein